VCVYLILKIYAQYVGRTRYKRPQ